MKEYNLNTILPFGEYKDHSLKYLIEINTNRLFWYIRTDLGFNNFYLDRESEYYTKEIAKELLAFKRSRLYEICKQVESQIVTDGFTQMLYPDRFPEKDDQEEPAYFLKDYLSRFSKYRITLKDKRLILNYQFNYWDEPVEKNLPKDLEEFIKLNKEKENHRPF